MTFLKTAAATAALVLFGASAQAATLDYKALADGTFYGESAYSTFSYGGLDVTATQDGETAFVYLDRGNAGMGVCGELTGSGSTGPKGDSGSNLCNPSSDDGLTMTNEILMFTATQALTVDAIYLNSNHDDDDILNTVWEILTNGLPFALAPFTIESISGDGDIKLTLGFDLGVGDYFTVRGVEGPNSYVSAVTVSAIPIPAAGFLLLGGLGGLLAMRRRKS